MTIAAQHHPDDALFLALEGVNGADVLVAPFSKVAFRQSADTPPFPRADVGQAFRKACLIRSKGEMI